MGIGTSKGSYYEDEFQHQAGVPTLPKGDEESVKKPADTGDDNVLPPDEGNYDKKGGVIQVGAKVPVWKDEPVDPPVPEDSPSITDKLFGLNGVERYKLWPERMINDLYETAGKVSKGDVPMWAMTPDGEFHTSIEGLESAHKLMPAANGAALYPRIHIRGEGLKALEEYHADPYETGASQQFQEMMARVRRQPSNIVEPEIIPPPPRPPSAPRAAHEDDTDYALRMIGEALDLPAYRTDPGLPSSRAARQSVDPFRQVPITEDHIFIEGEGWRPRNSSERPSVDHAFEENVRSYVEDLNSIAQAYHEEGYGTYWPTGLRQGETFEAFARRTIERDPHLEDSPTLRDWQPTRASDDAYVRSVLVEPPTPKQYSPEVKAKIEQAKKKDNISLIKVDWRSSGNNHEFKFASKDGVGKLGITLNNRGKHIRVNSIAKVNSDGYAQWDSSVYHTFGTKEIKQFVKLLMEEYPKAEEISGFRVGGARIKSGRGSSDAFMRLPGRGKTKAQQQAEDAEELRQTMDTIRSSFGH